NARATEPGLVEPPLRRRLPECERSAASPALRRPSFVATAEASEHPAADLGGSAMEHTTGAPVLPFVPYVTAEQGFEEWARALVDSLDRWAAVLHEAEAAGDPGGVDGTTHSRSST